MDYIGLAEQVRQGARPSPASDSSDASPASAQPAAPEVVAPSEAEAVPEDSAYWAAVQSALGSDQDADGPETADLPGTSPPIGLI